MTYAQSVPALISKNVGNTLTNYKTWGGILYNVKDTAYGSKGDGIANDSSSVQSAVTAATANGGIVFFPPGTYRLSNALTVPANVTFWFANGAKLSIDTGITVTINGPIDAELYQIFSGLGTVSGFSKVPIAYPQWWGAKGDGVNDDTTAIQSAVNIGSTRVHLISGNYFITAKITITKSIQITGDGAYETSIIRNSTSMDAFLVSAINSSIEHLGIKRTDLSITPTGGNAIELTASNCYVDEVYIERGYNGIYANGTAGETAITYLTRLHINYFVGIGILVSKANDIFLDEFIINSQNSTALAGIRFVDKAEAFAATNGDILNCSYSMNMTATVNGLNARPAYNKFTNVYFDSSQNGVLLDSCVSFRFTDCWFSNRPNNGCVVQNADDITFSNCDFINCGSNGCLVQSTAKRVKFNTCSFIANNYNNVGSHGLSISPATTDFSIQGCTATNGLGFSGLQGYGIILNAGASDRYIIADNLVSGNVQAVGVSDGGTGTNKRVANNY